MLELLFSLYTLFKKLKHNTTILDSKEKEITTLNDELKEISTKFEHQSKEYAKNINALDKHKRITHVVEVLVTSESPQTGEGKKIIKMLRISVEKSLKDSD